MHKPHAWGGGKTACTVCKNADYVSFYKCVTAFNKALEKTKSKPLVRIVCAARLKDKFIEIFFNLGC